MHFFGNPRQPSQQSIGDFILYVGSEARPSAQMDAIPQDAYTTHVGGLAAIDENLAADLSADFSYTISLNDANGASLTIQRYQGETTGTLYATKPGELAETIHASFGTVPGRVTQFQETPGSAQVTLQEAELKKALSILIALKPFNQQMQMDVTAILQKAGVAKPLLSQVGTTPNIQTIGEYILYDGNRAQPSLQMETVPNGAYRTFVGGLAIVDEILADDLSEDFSYAITLHDEGYASLTLNRYQGKTSAVISTQTPGRFADALESVFGIDRVQQKDLATEAHVALDSAEDIKKAYVLLQALKPFNDQMKADVNAVCQKAGIDNVLTFAHSASLSNEI